MIKFYDGQITDILPSNLTDNPEVKAISLALRDATRLLWNDTQGVLIYSNIEHLPDAILDLLAIELRTQYYRDSLDIETKRALIRNTLIWHMRAGTPQAVEELVTTIFGEGKVTEWFEYGDLPYYFRIETNAALTPEIDSFFSTMIRRVKNTRSHLRSIEIRRKVEHRVWMGGEQLLCYKPPAILDGYAINRSTKQNTYIGISDWQLTHQEAVLDGFCVADRKTIGHTYFGASIATVERAEAVREVWQIEKEANPDATTI